jgi:hypothetical protein
MKINTHDLRRLYQASLADKIPPSRKRCPAAAQIIGLFDGSLSKRRKTRLVEHLARCGSCFQEFDSLRLIYHHQDTMIDDLTAWAARREKRKDQGHIEDARGGYGSPRYRGPRGRTRPRLWAYALGLAALVLCLVLAVDHRSVFKNVFEKKYRAVAASKIELVHPPSAKFVLRRTLYFQWDPFPRAQRYFVELFDQELKPVWKSQDSTAIKIVLPPEIAERLHLAQPYYWLVTGILADDKRAESDIGVFSLKGP